MWRTGVQVSQWPHFGQDLFAFIRASRRPLAFFRKLWRTRGVPREIERKFLVRSDAWKQVGKPVRITQGYLSRVNERVVRVRLAANKGWITVKGKAQGPRRKEFEYEI